MQKVIVALSNTLQKGERRIVMTKAEQVEVIRKKIEFEKKFLEDQIKKKMMQGKRLEIAQLKKHKKNNLNLMRVVTA